MRREKLCLCNVSIHAISAGQRMIPESNKLHDNFQIPKKVIVLTRVITGIDF